MAVWNDFCWRNQPLWCLKHKYLDINLLFIELFYKINITFVTMQIFNLEYRDSCVILTI